MASGKEKIHRETILAAGAEVFCEMGFHEASMSTIAARLGSSEVSVYRCFPSKESLFIELLQRASNGQAPSMMDLLRNGAGIGGNTAISEAINFPDISDSNYSLKETLITFGEYVLNVFHTPQSLTVQRVVIAATIHSDVGYTYYAQGPAKAIERLSDFFTVHIKAGILRETDARVAACHYFGLLQSEIYQIGIFNVLTSIQPSITKIIVARAVDIFLKGYEREHDVIQRASL